VQLHEFVGVARITILAAEFTAAIRINCPAKRHARIVAFCQIFTCWELEIFNAALCFERRALGGQASDPDKFSHLSIFALCSPNVKHNSVVAFPARNVFTIKEFEERDRILPGNAGPGFEVRDRESGSDSCG
jgi:hypothetical protein